MKIMPTWLQQEPKDTRSAMNFVTQDFVNALHELVQMQQQPRPAQLHLDTRIQLPKYAGKMCNVPYNIHQLLTKICVNKFFIIYPTT